MIGRNSNQFAKARACWSSKPSARRRPGSGFTLVEVIVAVGVLSVGLIGVIVMSAGLLKQAGIADELDHGCLLARAKIAGLAADGGYEEGTEEGDFEEEGHADYQWRAETSLFEDSDDLYLITVTVWKADSDREWKLVSLVREGELETTGLYTD